MNSSSAVLEIRNGRLVSASPNDGVGPQGLGLFQNDTSGASLVKTWKEIVAVKGVPAFESSLNVALKRALGFPNPIAQGVEKTPLIEADLLSAPSRSGVFSSVDAAWGHLAGDSANPLVLWKLLHRELFSHQNPADIAALMARGEAITDLQIIPDDCRESGYPVVECAFAESLAVMCHAESVLFPKSSGEQYVVLTRKELIGTQDEMRRGTSPHTDGVLFDNEGKPMLLIRRAYNAVSTFPTLSYEGNRSGVNRSDLLYKLTELQAWHEEPMPHIMSYLANIGATFRVCSSMVIYCFQGSGVQKDNGWIHMAQPFLWRGLSGQEPSGKTYLEAGLRPRTATRPTVRRMATLFIGTPI